MSFDAAARDQTRALSHRHASAAASATTRRTARDRDWYLAQRARYTDRALCNAFPRDRGSGWDPTRGWRANRSRAVALYDYYRDLFNRRPNEFLWAGLARLAGGAVVGGLDAVPDDRNRLIETMLEAGRCTFDDLAWQHEAAAAAPGDLPELAGLHDAHVRARTSYRGAWEKILSGDVADVRIGNRKLLENEQFSITQPCSDALRANPPSRPGWLVRLMRRASNLTFAIHPYHRDFSLDFPTGDVGDSDVRWLWIMLEGGMWEKWVAMPAAERARLVNLDFDAIVRGSFGETIEELLPAGRRGAIERPLAFRRARVVSEIVLSYRPGRGTAT